MPSNTKATPPHAPRLCQITRSPDFNGYGFNLHTIKNKSGQFIGQVDDGSPAQKALLKEGDRIVEVNGVNIASENHKQVVSRIKMVPDETKLLVVDDQADKWYKDHNIVISSSLPEVVKGYSNKSRHPSTSSSEADVKESKPEDRRSVDSASSAATSEASHRQGEESGDSPDVEEPLEGKLSGPVAAKKDDDTSSSSEDDDAEESDKEKVLSNGKHEETEVDKAEGNSLNAANNTSEVKTAVVITETPATDEEEDSSSSEEEEEEEEEDEEDSSDTEDQKTAVQQVAKAAPAEKAAVALTKEDTVSEKSSRSNSSASASSSESDKSPPKAPVVASKSPLSASPTPPSSVGAPSPTPAYTFKNTDGLNMNMSAAQMREYLASKKKKDIRHSEIDMRKKYDIIQKL